MRFVALHDFNATNAMPLLRWSDGRYLLLQHYSLLEAIYESPIFWMMRDKAYFASAISNRGVFTESFAAKCLETVFKSARVWRNIDIYGAGGNRVGEIDVLAVFGRRAVLVQAKSKRLTIEARKGNDLQIKDDFKKAVQDAADHAFLCAEALLDEAFVLRNATGNVIAIPRELTVVHPICVVSDHYPALALQVSHYLKMQVTDRVFAPLVIDVFALDVMSEMLATPLHFLHYLTLRNRFGAKLSMSHELTLLGYHLARNLWLEDGFDMVTLGDDFSTHLDIAMLVRREGIPGAHTPEGILTRLKDTTFGRLIDQIEESDDPDAGELGLELLQLGEETARSLSSAIDTIAEATRQDRRVRDASVLLGKESGLTIHCRYDEGPEAAQRLINHCEIRKYSSRVDSWHGLLIDPDTRLVRLSVGTHEPWTLDPELEKALAERPLPEAVPWGAMKQHFSARSGRNDSCPCGSGKKFKKCCRR